MLQGLKHILQSEQGAAFIENALWIILVVLFVASVAFALANEGINPKFKEVKNTISNVNVPTIDTNTP